jgi:two-component system, OmpR family, phosphate regulon sensor histidine kinase PhoR
MPDKMSFRAFLLLCLWGLLVLALILPFWYLYAKLHVAIAEDQKQKLVRQLNLVSMLMTQEVEFRNPEQLQSWLMQIANPLELRLTYIAADGRVLADSLVPFEQIKDLEDFSGRPEIAQALRDEPVFMIRFSRIMQKEQIYAARGIQPKGTLPAGVIRLAASETEDHRLLRHLRNLFFLVLPLIFAAGALLRFLFIRRLKQALTSLTGAVEGIALGDYRRRLHFPPGDEMFALGDAINRMAENAGRQFLDLKAQKQELEAVFNAMREGVMVLDARGRIQTVNRALVELVGSETQLLGRRPLEVILSLELQETCDRILAAKGSLQESSRDLLVLIGEGRAFEVNIVRLEDQDRETGALLVFHDMSRLKQLERVRQDFVANVSHELRTPLTSIKGYTETLLAEAQSNPELFTAFLEIILKNTNHMVKLVDDLLQLARIEARQDAFKPVQVNPGEALAVAWKACFPFAEARHVNLISHLPESGIWVSADFDQLVRVFRNLLENAIRYSPESGAVTVGGHADGNTMTFSVSNDGPPIAKYHQQRIFERFYRIEKDRRGDLGNTGLGLAICRHIVLNHGGLIWVRSPNPDRPDGATFYFTMVRAIDE